MKIITLLFISVLCIQSSYSQENEINNYIKKVMNDRHIPGVSAAVIKDSKVIYMKSFGLSNIETNTNLTNESVFQLASLTKPFTALCIMKLSEEGKINLNSSITDYIDSLPEKYKTITVHHLLTHTAGFPDQVNLEFEKSPVFNISTKNQLEIILKAPLLFPAGESCSYADPGYFLLGMIIEKASGILYKDYLQQAIFKPLGMEHSLVEDRWKIIYNRVAPYKYFNNLQINGRRDYHHELPSHFGILSTITDLTKWELALRNNNVVSSESLKKMWIPAKLNNGDDALTWGVNYGYGWMLGDIRGNKYAEHGGFSGTHDVHFIDKDLTVIVLTNLDVMSNSDPRSIAHAIAGLVDSELAKPSIIPSESKIKDNDIQKILFTFSQSLDKGVKEELLSKQYATFLKNLPPPVMDRLLPGWKAISKLECIGKDDVENKGIVRFGEKIKTIWHYQLITENEQVSYAIYITDNHKISGITKWKE